MLTEPNRLCVRLLSMKILMLDLYVNSKRKLNVYVKYCPMRAFSWGKVRTKVGRTLISSFCCFGLRGVCERVLSALLLNST